MYAKKNKQKHPKYWPADFRGRQINLLKRKNGTGPNTIPKKIHQIWIGNKTMNEIKLKLTKKLKDLYHGYEYRLWGNEDITR
jgi:mannosyltransferase OCH1-like enzyme